MAYQDYVIKDGKFIGKFEEMYQDFEDPWFQSEEAEISYSRNDTIHTIRRFGLKNVIEAGCGLGNFTSKLNRMCEETKITGLDVSETAIRKARKRFPEVSFVRGSILDLDKLFDLKAYDGIIFAEILWYVLDDLDFVIQMLKENFHGILIVNQVFYSQGVQQYGKEYFTNQNELIDYFALKPVVRNVSHDTSHENSYETHTVFQI